MSTQTETKPSQPVSLPFIIVRMTAAALPVSPRSPPSVCVCVCVFLRIPPSQTVYFTKEAIYDDVREITLGEREENRRRCWKEANFILAASGWPEGRWLFLYSRCSLENGLSSASLREHKRRQRSDRGCPSARLTLLCVYLYILHHLGTSGHLSKQSFIVHLFMHAHARLSTDLISCVRVHVYVCVSRPPLGPVQATVLSTERWVSALLSWQMYPPACPLALTASP